MSTEETTIISTELFDEIVDALADLPYRRIAAIFRQLAVEVQAQQEPKIHIN